MEFAWAPVGSSLKVSAASVCVPAGGQRSLPVAPHSLASLVSDSNWEENPCLGPSNWGAQSQGFLGAGSAEAGGVLAKSGL